MGPLRVVWLALAAAATAASLPWLTLAYFGLAFRLFDYCEDAGAPCTDAVPVWAVGQAILALGGAGCTVLGLAQAIAFARRRGPEPATALLLATLAFLAWVGVFVGLRPD